MFQQELVPPDGLSTTSVSKFVHVQSRLYSSDEIRGRFVSGIIPKSM